MQTIQVKTVFLGDANVGKSSILNRFIENQFDENIQATSGADFKVKTINHNNKKIDFHLWDTAGQERFRSLTQLYYKDATVACIVYDITNKNSFGVLNYWFKELKNNAKDNIIKVIIGNKIDLPSQQQVQLDQAQSMAKVNDAILVLTSAKEGTGIQEVFQKIAAQIEQQSTSNQPKHQTKIMSKEKKVEKKPSCC